MQDKYKKMVTEVNIDLIKPYWKNVKIWNNVDKVKASIERFGYNSFIEVDEEFVIINWHSRYKALKALWYDKIKVNMIIDIPKKEAQAYRIVDNKVAEANDWDLNNLKIEMRQLWDIWDMQPFFDDIDLPTFIKDDLWQSFSDIWSDEIIKQNDKMNGKFDSTESSNKDLQKSNLTICPECYHEFEVRS